MIPDLTREQLKTHLDHGEPIQLVDALPPDKFEFSHLPGAINIPAEEVALLAPRLLTDKQQRIVVYGAGRECDASKRAAIDLVNMGYRQVMIFRGGKRDWIAAGFAIVGQYANRGLKPEEAA